MPNGTIFIGNAPQFFFDNYTIEVSNFFTRTVQNPKRYGNNPLIKKDKPWEQVLYFRTNTWNVYWDSQENLFKCWYEDLGFDFDAFAGKSTTNQGVVAPGFNEACDNRYLYAESKDGINWEKPELDYRTVNGQKTNICLGNEQDGKAHAATFLLDENEPESSKRFKVLFWNDRKDMPKAINKVAYSPDGRVWMLCNEPVTFGGNSERGTGDVIIVNRDMVTGEYILDTRQAFMCEYPGPWQDYQPRVNGWGLPIYPNDPMRNTKRRIFNAYSKDFLNWTALREILSPDPVEDNLDDEYYGMARFRMGDIWVALLNKFHRTPNTVEIYLVYSRDGYNWNHAQRQPLLANSEQGNWDCYMTETCCQPVFLNDEIRLYYAGSNFHHDWWQFGCKEGLDHPEAQLGPKSGETAWGLSTLRTDGFVSLDSDIREGLLITRPLVSNGDKLIVNVKCKEKGYFLAELLDEQSNVIPGYEKSNCDNFTGDNTKHIVTWKGKSNLPKQAMSKGVKLCFCSKQASIYSFKIV